MYKVTRGTVAHGLRFIVDDILAVRHRSVIEAAVLAAVADTDTARAVACDNLHNEIEQAIEASQTSRALRPAPSSGE